MTPSASRSIAPLSHWSEQWPLPSGESDGSMIRPGPQLEVKGGVFQGWLKRKEPATLLSVHEEWYFARAMPNEKNLTVLIDASSTTPDTAPSVDLYRLALEAA